jgi:hypothetical protein
VSSRRSLALQQKNQLPVVIGTKFASAKQRNFAQLSKKNRWKLFMQYSIYKKYAADSGRGTGNEKVVYILLTSPNDILQKDNNFVLDCLEFSGVSSSIGLYFYLFQKEKRFIKIGECTSKEGISKRFSRGWHGTERYADTYHSKKVKDKVNGDTFIESDFCKEIKKISVNNPAYFIFYEHQTMQSYPKIDEMFAYRMHKRLFKCDTTNTERINTNTLLARRLIWHKKSFSEVTRRIFPDGML